MCVCVCVCVCVHWHVCMGSVYVCVQRVLCEGCHMTEALPQTTRDSERSPTIVSTNMDKGNEND